MATFQGLNYITPITINSRERYFRSETINLKTQVVGNGAQRWDLLVTLEPATSIGGSAAGAALGVHRSTHGFRRSFTMEMPQYLNTDVTGDVRTLVATQAYSPGVNQINVDRASGDNLVVIPAGRFITFGGSTKVYQLTQEFRLPPGTVQADLHIFPDLVDPIVDPSSGDTIPDCDPDITVFYAEDGTEGVTYSDGVLVRAQINVVEALT